MYMYLINLTEHQLAFQKLRISANQIPAPLSPQISNLIYKISRELMLFQNHRQTRGIFNAIGRGINFITGNMDDEDAKKIGEQIRNLEENQENIAKYSNKLNYYNKRINEELNNITMYVNSQNN